MSIKKRHQIAPFMKLKMFNEQEKIIGFAKDKIQVIISLPNIDDFSNNLNKTIKTYSENTDCFIITSSEKESTSKIIEKYELQKEYIIFKDSIETFELSTKIDELQAKLTTVEKEKENELLKAEKNTYQKTIQSRNATALALILGLLLIGSWAIIVSRNNRRKQKYNEELETTVAERTAELQTANKNLKQANYELRTFNYIASHDIKEPIRNIGNYAGLIFRKLPNELRVSLGDYFKTIKQSTSQLYTLIEDFAKYTTLSKDDTIEKQEVDLNWLVDGIEKGLHETIQKYNGQVINHGLPIIQSSSSLLYTTLKNLIENGLKYNQSPIPTVEISYHQTEIYHQIIACNLNGDWLYDAPYVRVTHVPSAT